MMNSINPAPSAIQPPLIGTWNSSRAITRMTVAWTSPTST